jgi:type 1 glutamine amidotransferase
MNAMGKFRTLSALSKHFWVFLKGRVTSCYLLAIFAGGMLAATGLTPTLMAAEPSILIVVGPSNHPPGTHEEAAGARLMKHCLETAGDLPLLTVTVAYEWPAKPELLDSVSTVVFIGDQFPGARLENSPQVMRDLERMMTRGCGLVCVHYATGLTKRDVTPEGDHPLLHWIGGYFATGCDHHRSVARVMDATIEPGDATHPVMRGWNTFSLHDEPYYNNYFGPDGPADNVVTVASSMLPPENPKREVVAWGVQRKDGGRGIGVVMPHFFRSWEVDDLRTMILNSIVWTAGMEVPQEGVQSTLPPLETFAPQSVEPR